jgi:hypothetical protein
VRQSETLAAWLVYHPRLRVAVGAMTALYVLCLWAVVAAPRASAAVGSAALGWTGLHDSDGVPLADYFLSVVDTTEATLNNGQGVGLNPTSWAAWVIKATNAAITHGTVAWWLTNEAALIVFGLGIAFWLLKFALSSSWLLALAQIGRPVFAAVHLLVSQMWLGPLAIAVCVILAGHYYRSGQPGRGLNLLGTAAVLTALVWTVFRNPIDDMVSDHGLLGMARATGFQIAQDARQASYAPGGSLDAQLDALVAQLISATARPALQLQNFGMVVDDIGSCRHAWSQAILAAHGTGDGPAHAMATCGAPQALAHAQQLGANDFVLGLVFLFAAFWIGVFHWYVGLSTMLVGVKATYYCIVVVPAAMMGMTGWQRGKAFAIRCGSQVLLHGVEMIIFTVFLALAAEGMGWTLTTPQLGRGGAFVVARLLMASIGSAIGIMLFRYIDKHFYTDGFGTIGHHLAFAWGSARDGVRDEYNNFADAGRKARGVIDRFRRGPGDDPDAQVGGDTTDDAATESVPGFDVVKPRPGRPRPDSAPTAATQTAGRAASGASAGEAAGTAAEIGAEGGAAAAAEGAATVAAPEVVVPAVVVSEAAKHLRGHRTNGAAHPERTDHERGPGDETPPPSPPFDRPADQPAYSEVPPGLTSTPRRPARAQRPTSMDSTGGSPDQDPALPFAPTDSDQAPVEAAVEFQTPPRPRGDDRR